MLFIISNLYNEGRDDPEYRIVHANSLAVFAYDGDDGKGERREFWLTLKISGPPTDTDLLEL